MIGGFHGRLFVVQFHLVCCRIFVVSFRWQAKRILWSVGHCRWSSADVTTACRGCGMPGITACGKHGLAAARQGTEGYER